MVRLKANKVNISSKEIFEISIPYGAIKRLALLKTVNVTTTFQFLMVRLKVLRKKSKKSRKKNFNSLWCD